MYDTHESTQPLRYGTRLSPELASQVTIPATDYRDLRDTVRTLIDAVETISTALEKLPAGDDRTSQRLRHDAYQAHALALAAKTVADRVAS